MPLIGAVQAGARPSPSSKRKSRSKLEAKYLQSAQVSVFVKEANSQQVTVDGAVEKPGMVTLKGQTTLLQTIAMSGGLARGADPRGIVVFRTVGQKKMAAKFDLKAIRAGNAEDPVLYGGDIVVVDTSAFGTRLAGSRDALPVFGLVQRRFGTMSAQTRLWQSVAGGRDERTSRSEQLGRHPAGDGCPPLVAQRRTETFGSRRQATSRKTPATGRRDRELRSRPAALLLDPCFGIAGSCLGRPSSFVCIGLLVTFLLHADLPGERDDPNRSRAGKDLNV